MSKKIGLGVIQHLKRWTMWAAFIACLSAIFGCSFDPGATLPCGSVNEDPSVLHSLFPMVQQVIGCLPEGTIGGLVYGDFDCDGLQDLALGDPDQSVAGISKAGVVHVNYGSGDSEDWYQWLLDKEAPAANAFGLALAAGDFDGNGCDDLAVGAPGSVGSTGQVGSFYIGSVHIIQGSPWGLSLLPGEAPVILHAGSAQFFGTSLAAGQFDDDPFADLAVGSPRAHVAGHKDAGKVAVFSGGPTGIESGAWPRWFSQLTPGLKGKPEKYDFFGFALAKGDFDGNGIDDLAVSVPGENGGGAVNVLYGENEGLKVLEEQVQDQIWHQDSEHIKGKSEELDGCGFALATGDFNGDGFWDLAFGCPGESIRSLCLGCIENNIQDAGAVNVLYGGLSGLQADKNGTSEDDQIWAQDCTNWKMCPWGEDIPGEAEVGDFFGASLTAGDLNGDGFDDLAIGVPNDHFLGTADTGTVNVLFGSASGLNAEDSIRVYQKPASQPDDFFGSALAAGDSDGDGVDELAVRVNAGEACAANVFNFDSSSATLLPCSSLPRILGPLKRMGDTEIKDEESSQFPLNPIDNPGAEVAEDVPPPDPKFVGGALQGATDHLAGPDPEPSTTLGGVMLLNPSDPFTYADFTVVNGSDPCADLGGDTDGDTLCDNEDPCKSFANTLPLVISGFSGIPDECLCGDFDGDGLHSATDGAAINACAAFIRFDCVSERDEVTEPIDGFYTATDAALVNRVAGFLDPAYTLQCTLRPEGTCGGETGVSCF